MASEISTQIVEGFSASARRAAADLLSNFPDFPKTTAYVMPAVKNFCGMKFDSVFAAERQLAKLTARFHATHDRLLLERQLGQHE